MFTGHANEGSTFISHLTGTKKIKFCLQIEFLCLFSDYLLFNDLREAGDCGEDLLGIAATPLYCLYVGHVIA